MEIVIAPHSGFCFGVKRAVEIVREKAKKGKVYTLGPLIHNPPMVEKLKEEGILTISEDSEVRGKRVVIPSHGLPPQKLENIYENADEVIDATCPIVKNAQDMAKFLEEEGYEVFIIGDAEHSEVKGIAGNLKNSPVIISSINEIPEKIPKRVGIVSQTTMDIFRAKEIISGLIPKTQELRFINTICSAISLSQQALRNVLRKVDGIVVVGGKNSANTRRLYEISLNSGKKTWWIERGKELKREFFNGIKKIGITAGASTPDWIIKEVVEYLRKF